MKPVTAVATVLATAVVGLGLVSPSSAEAYVQFVPCATKDGKQRAAVWFYVNRKRYVYQVVYRLRGGSVSSRNLVQYRERVVQENGRPFSNASPGFHVRGQWRTRNDGKLRRMPADVQGREGGFGSSPWGWHRYMGETRLRYRPAVKFTFASGRACTAYSTP